MKEGPDITRIAALIGDPARAKIATLNINPSANEFLQNGRLLTSKQRQLATLESLSAQRLDQLTEAQVATIVADCATYFERRPYRRWFDPLDELLRAGADASYYDGSACHLDLVQWATQPMWGKITDPRARQALLDDGVPHLRSQLARENVRLVLLNGRQVIDQVVAVGLADLDEVGHLPLAGRICRLYAGTGDGVRWVAWSTNLQSSWGVSKAFKQNLGAWLAGVCTQPTEARMPVASVPTLELDRDGHLPRGLRVDGKTEFVNALRRWLAESGRRPSARSARSVVAPGCSSTSTMMRSLSTRTPSASRSRRSSAKAPLTRSARGGSSPTAAAASTRCSPARARSPYPAGTPTSSALCPERA